MENIINAIQNGNWEEALKLYLDYTSGNALSEELCVLGATILEQYGEFDDMFALINKGLLFNIKNYELYLLLGNYYRDQNPDKAYLCYENALFYAKSQGKNDDAEVIAQIKDALQQDCQISVKNISILILGDKDQEYTDKCKDAIKETCPYECYEISIADISDPQTYPDAINAAISLLSNDRDLFLLRNDIVLTTNALFNLRMNLYDSDKNGACGCISNIAFSKQRLIDITINTLDEAYQYADKENLPNKTPNELKAAIDMNFMLIKNELINEVFPLDTSIKSDSFQNIDLGLRILEKGFLNVVCWNSFVYRYPRNLDTPETIELYRNDRPITKSKWNFSPEYFLNTRYELIDLIDKPKDAEIEVLEVGSGLGSTLTRIKYDFPNCNVHGIEIMDQVVRFGCKLADMKCSNIETHEFNDDEKFDYILFGDVLEHLVDPYTLIERLKNHLKDGGCIITSIPNIMNANVIYDLLRGNFTYTDSGVLDRTHLRFFTAQEIINMFNERGYEITHMSGLAYNGFTTDQHPEFWNELLAIEGVAKKELFDPVQYLVCARKIR